MSIGSGLAASLGFAPETVYGTYVAPTKFPEFNKEDLKKVKNTVQGGGLAAGRLAQLGSRRVVTSEAASGSIEMEVPNKGFGLLLQHILGSSAVPVQQAATAAWLQTHALGDNIGKFLTGQVAVPDTTGTLRPQTFKGGKITSAEFSCGVDELLMVTTEYDFQRYSEVETLAAPSLSVGIMPFHFGQMSVKLGAVGAEAAVPGVKKTSLKIERGQATDRFYAGATVPGTKAEPIGNDWVKVSGAFDVDFVNKADFADRFHSDASTALVWDFTGPLIAATHFQRISFKVPLIFLDGDTAGVDGPGLVTTSFPFVGQLDGTNPLVSVEYMSTDIAI